MKIEIGMGILAVFLAATFFSCGCINSYSPPVDYYQWDAGRALPPMIYDESDLGEWLISTNWADEYEGNWDCSQMSAFLEWQFEKEGWDAHIIFTRSGTHAFVIVDVTGDGKYIAVESTGRFTVYPNENKLYPNTDYYDWDESYEDIYAIWYGNLYTKELFLEEWGWWM